MVKKISLSVKDSKIRSESLVKSLDVLHKNKVDMASRDLTELPKDIRAIVEEKRALYVDATKLKLEHERLNDLLLAHPQARDFRNLLCW